MDLRKWLTKLTPQQQQTQPLVSQNLSNGNKIPSITEDVQKTKQSKNLLG